MWRGFLAAGMFFAFLGAVVVLVVMVSTAGCTGGYNCAPSTIAMSVGVLLIGLGFLLVAVAFGTRPAEDRGSTPSIPGAPPPTPASTYPSLPPGGGTFGGTATGPRGRLGSFGLSRTVLIGAVLFFVGLLISVAGYLEFFSGDWFNYAYATWNYPNGGVGVAIMAVGMLLWLSALVFVSVVIWRGPRAAPSVVPIAPSPTYYSPTATVPGGFVPPPPPPPPAQLPLPPPPPPPPYPPGAG